MSRALREIAAPFVAAAPAGARVRTRLRVSPQDAAVLRAVGRHLGSLAGRDLAARCAEGKLDARARSDSRRERKRALTADSSSRWAGAITRVSEDQYQRAEKNLRDQRGTLAARARKIEKRLAVQAGGEAGRTRGYATPADRHAKTLRLKALKSRLARVQRRLDSGAVSVVRGGRRLLRTRLNLEDAGLTEARWRQRWEAARLFIQADGERDKDLGNETLRWHPDEHWSEIRLPTPLAHLANRPHNRYRLSCSVEFTHPGRRGRRADRERSRALRRQPRPRQGQVAPRRIVEDTRPPGPVPGQPAGPARAGGGRQRPAPRRRRHRPRRQRDRNPVHDPPGYL